MSDNDLYKRHKDVEMSVPEEIFVVGCGGTGTWVSIMSAMVGVKKIHIADHDILENHNRSRLPYIEDDVGKLKTEVLCKFIKNIRPDCNVYIYDGIHNEIDLFVLTGEVVFDCNDNSQVQDMIYKYCKEHNLKYISVGCNADHITVLDNLDILFRSKESNPYEITPIFLIPPIIAASAALWNVIKQKESVKVLRTISEIFEER